MKPNRTEFIGINLYYSQDFVDDMRKELERLKEEYIMLQNASDEVEEELQQRINKAIEYITTEQLYTNYQWGEEFYSQLLKDLLNILKGSDKE